MRRFDIHKSILQPIVRVGKASGQLRIDQNHCLTILIRKSGKSYEGLMRDFQLPGRSAVFASNGICATSHPLAAKVAVQILESGGNAVDAAIAASVLLGICEPQMTGLGGDCFVLLKPSGAEEIIALNGSGRAPAALNSAVIRQNGHDEMPLDSAASVTVPGAVDAFCRLARDHGRIGLKAVLAPAIYYASAGVPVAPRTAFDWAAAAGRLQGKAREFYLLDGKAPKPGQMFRAPGQAEALEQIALKGRDGFYSGEVAEDMVRSLNAMGGVHSVEDFENCKSDYTTPISGEYKCVELIEHPPNGQGATAILMNNILSHFDLPSLDPLGAERAHLEAEATKLAYDARNRLIADPAGTKRLDHLLNSDTAKSLAALIKSDRALSTVPQITEAVHKDTVYVTVVDRDLTAVSLIYSIFHSFGSGLASDRFGINFQNRGAGFTLDPGHPNEAGGGKRPMHTIIPGMLKLNGRVTSSFGVMGGQYQPCGHSRYLSNIVDFGMDPQSAIDAPRSFADGHTLQVERGYTADVRAALAAKGHQVVVPDGPIGGAQSITIDYETGTFLGASDPRKDGCALGY